MQARFKRRRSGNSAISSRLPVGAAPASRKPRRQRRPRVIEIAERQRRIVVALAAEEAGGVAAVFAQQRIGVVFRMALEEQKEAAVLLGEGIDARRIANG